MNDRTTQIILKLMTLTAFALPVTAWADEVDPPEALSYSGGTAGIDTSYIVLLAIMVGIITLTAMLKIRRSRQSEQQ